jgi:hypothetical protein
MTPDEEADDGDRNRAEGDEGVAEDALAAEAGDELADHAHGRQDHDVDGRVTVEPEDVLKQHGVSTD